MLFPGEWHRYHPDPGVGWEEHWLGFAGEYARQLLKKRLFSPRAPVFSVGADHATTGAFARAVELVRLEPVGFQQAVAAVTWEVLGRIHSAERLRAVEADGLGRIVRETKLHLAERLEQPIDLHALANHLAVSYSTLRQAFKHHTGFAPHQYQLELRVAEAKHLLAGSVLPVKEIAARLGFQSPSYFSRLFKNRTGLSPETWRHDAQSGDHASREEH
jgi:transcriptional regulator GlxA family with amidase domain